MALVEKKPSVDSAIEPQYVPPPIKVNTAFAVKGNTMKVVNSLKSAKKRDRFCRVIRRRGRTYVINKRNPRFKARQG